MMASFDRGLTHKNTHTHTHTHTRTHTHIHTYVHPKISNEAGFGHRQPRMVTSAAKPVEALQQLYAIISLKTFCP